MQLLNYIYIYIELQVCNCLDKKCCVVRIKNRFKIDQLNVNIVIKINIINQNVQVSSEKKSIDFN